MTIQFAQQHYRFNYRLWVLETSTWVAATAFIDSTTVLPVLVLALSDSPFLASLILSIRYLGQGWPQLIAASMVSGKQRKPFYVRAVIPGRLLLLWPMLALLLDGDISPSYIVAAILLAYLAFWISEGFSIVPWVDMVGKTIPPMRRGRLFAAMHIIGGLLGIGAGLLIQQLLQSRSYPFPTSYGILFGFALCGLAVSTLAIAFIREPPSPPHEERYSTTALIKDIPNLLRSMPQFRLLILVQALFGFSILPAPFYILYATQLLQQAAQVPRGEASLGVGIFLAIQTGGMIFGNAVWGYISDHYGNRLLMRVLALAHAFVPFSALLAGLFAPAFPTWTIYLVFAPTFFLFGGLLGGTWMGITNYLLELAPEHDRPAYIAVANALNLPAFILPLIGGLLAHILGYPALFAIAILFLLYALFLTGRLTEPREMLTHHHYPPPEAWM